MMSGMHSQSVAPPTETEALDCLVRQLRDSKTQKFGSERYDVQLANVVETYVRINYPAPLGSNPQQWVSEISQRLFGPFGAAAWGLCRLGVIHPGPKYLDVFGSSFKESGGYCLTDFGRRWLAETPPSLPPSVGKMTDMLLGAGSNFGDAYKLRTQDAVLAYNGHAYFACCAMVGAASEAILLTAAVKKLGQERAEQLYLGSNGRSKLQKSLLGQQPEQFRTQFDRHTSLIAYWRDQSAHGHQTGIEEGEAYMALNGLLRFAHFASDNWQSMTG
jgi:hypothetical protein